MQCSTLRHLRAQEYLQAYEALERQNTRIQYGMLIIKSAAERYTQALKGFAVLPQTAFKNGKDTRVAMLPSSHLGVLFSSKFRGADRRAGMARDCLQPAGFKLIGQSLGSLLQALQPELLSGTASRNMANLSSLRLCS
jgi:hypothetical protein